MQTSIVTLCADISDVLTLQTYNSIWLSILRSRFDSAFNFKNVVNTELYALATVILIFKKCSWTQKGLLVHISFAAVDDFEPYCLFNVTNNLLY